MAEVEKVHEMPPAGAFRDDDGAKVAVFVCSDLLDDSVAPPKTSLRFGDEILY